MGEYNTKERVRESSLATNLVFSRVCEEFEIQHSGLDEATGEKDYVMTWQHK